MSRKRAAGQIAPSQMLEIATRIVAWSEPKTTVETATTFTDGAIEGLRVSHHCFLERLAAEVAKRDKLLVSQNDVVEALREMGLTELAQEALRRCAAPSAKGAKARKKRGSKNQKWTKEMEEEQEKLFAQSKEFMEQLHADK